MVYAKGSPGMRRAVCGWRGKNIARNCQRSRKFNCAIRLHFARLLEYCAIM